MLMIKKITIFALLLFASCEVHENIRLCRFEMIFSDGLPVQFWPVDCETFNEKEVDGINRACWCQPWQCDDEIIVQFQDDDSSPEPEYALLVKNSLGAVLTDLTFDKIADNTFSKTFVASEHDVCDQQISLAVATTEALEALEPSSWDDVDTAFDSKTSTHFIAEVTEDNGAFGATMPLVVAPGESVRVVLSFSMSGTWTPATGTAPAPFQFDLRDGSGNIVSNADLIALPFNGSAGGSVTLTATEESAVLSLRVFKNVGSGTADVSITITALTKYLELFKSDCLNIRTVQEETELFEYSNNRNYYGLVYEDASPAPSFFIRVPCVFFHERFPQEDRAIERTGSTVVTSSKLKTQRLLQVKHSPDYFHKKLIMVLSQHNVTNGGKQWKKEEAYEKEDGDIRYPLKRATVYLTEKNFLVRNTL